MFFPKSSLPSFLNFSLAHLLKQTYVTLCCCKRDCINIFTHVGQELKMAIMTQIRTRILMKHANIIAINAGATSILCLVSSNSENMVIYCTVLIQRDAYMSALI